MVIYYRLYISDAAYKAIEGSGIKTGGGNMSPVNKNNTFPVFRVPKKEIATAPLSFAYFQAAEPRNDRTGYRSSVISQNNLTIARFNGLTEIPHLFNFSTLQLFNRINPFPEKIHPSPVLRPFFFFPDLGLRIWVFIFHYSLNKSCSTEGDCFTSLRFVRNDLTGHPSSIKSI